ncbi:hypothetical protein B4N89_46805 [Embleya scabrispora]|uniref:Response regulatory domain-containing protein n=1 Tax=Embleya scabrispora TaxID=159449 RepID=A0A1T3NIT0_9ACTN|nr:hypothetical protein B4N89_46805 [Embleya scabrispora]
MGRAVERRAAGEAAVAAATGANYPQLGEAWWMSRQAARQRWPGLVFAATPDSRPLPEDDPPSTAGVYDVLLVEDDLADGFLIEEGLRTQGRARAVHRVEDGAAAMDYLRAASSTRPDLIVVDLNVPRMSGRELLTALNDDPNVRAIPVVVLTNSTAPADVAMAFDLQANAYVTKPARAEDFLSAIRGIDAFFHDAPASAAT